MAHDLREDDEWIDPSIHCSNCSAVCCRLLVFVEPDDQIPQELVRAYDQSTDVMARADDGWCVALDRIEMRCSIYEARPDSCHRFTMGGSYCRAVREDYRRQAAPVIPHLLIDAA